MQSYSPPLIALEGIDGAGKSTQAALLLRWLLSLGVPAVSTAWNSSRLVRPAIRKAKRDRLLTPRTYSLLHAADFADRHDRLIVPSLKQGMPVIADRYVYTAFARDVARGLDPAAVRNLYHFAYQADLRFYLRVPVVTAASRIVRDRKRIRYYEAGMDLGLSEDRTESFCRFQTKVIAEYEAMKQYEGFIVIDTSLAIEEQQDAMRRHIVERCPYFAPARQSVSSS